jgi:3-deoxy-D-manno-octulosonate 8-phosphate phosphatase (KDO 8-P phosphatase)
MGTLPHTLTWNRKTSTIWLTFVTKSEQSARTESPNCLVERFRFTDGWLRDQALTRLILPNVFVEAALVSTIKISPALKKRAAQIQLLLMDVDGTMTDGSVTLLSQTDGTALEIKTFDAHDGQGLTLAHTAGLRTGCITGRESAALLRRAHEMHMEFVYMKQPLKMPAYENILREAAVSDSAVAYIGDDLPDIPLMRRAGLAIAVGDAVPEVKAAAHYTTKALAGHGAIREAVEVVLKSKGIWEAMIDKARA